MLPETNFPENNSSNCQLIVIDEGNEQQGSIYHSIHEPEPQQASSVNELLTSKKQSTAEFQFHSDLKHSLEQSSAILPKKRAYARKLTESQKFFKKYLVLSYVNKFAKSMLSTVRPQSAFLKTHHQLIGDKASSFKNQTLMNPVNRKVLQYEHLLNIGLKLRMKFMSFQRAVKKHIFTFYLQLPLIEPDSNFKYTWDIVLFFLRIYLVVIIPIIIAFENTEVSQSQPVIQVLISILLFIDIFLRSFTIAYEQGVQIKDKHKLAQRQLNAYTYLEIATLIVSIIVAINLGELDNYFILDSEGWPKVLLLGLYLQINNILDLVDTFQQKIKPSKQINSIIELLKLVTVIILVQHFCCCIWVVIGEQAHRAENVGWMTKLPSFSWEYKYLEALYFMSVTMFTVGYGDIYPRNYSEKIFCICYMFLSTMQLSYSVNTIGSILTQMKESNESVRKKLVLINEYMQEKQIGHQLQQKQFDSQSRVREYSNHYLRPELFEQRKEQNELIGMLPQFLQESLQIEAASVILDKCDFFKKNFSKDTQYDLLRISSFENYQPGVTIARTGEDISLFVVEYGEVDMYQGKQLIQRFRKQEQCNLQEFLHGYIDDQVEYKTSEYTSVLKINRAQFMQILQRKQDELEHFLILIQKKSFKQFCLICANSNHDTTNCKLVHFIPDRERTIKQYQMNQSNSRARFERFQGKQNTLVHFHQLQELVKAFRSENQALIAEDISELFMSNEEISCQHQHSNLESQSHQSRTNPINSFDIRLKRSETNMVHSKQKMKFNSALVKLKLKSAKDPLLHILEQDHNKKELELIAKLRQLNQIRERFSLQQQQEIEFWLMKYSNYYESTVHSMQFEKIKTYLCYAKRWNIKYVVRRIERWKRKKYETLPEWSRFTPYILNVWSVLKKYYLKRFKRLSKKEDTVLSENKSPMTRSKFKRISISKRTSKQQRRSIYPEEITSNEYSDNQHLQP